MGRATTKSDLIASANTQFEKLQKLVDSMTEEQQNAAFDFGPDFKGKEAHWGRDKNLRDVLVHLYEWHQLFINWVTDNMGGEEKPFLPPPYNWKSYGQMNVGFWEKHQDTPLDLAKDLVKRSHADVLAIVEGLSNDELFTKAYFKWTGANAVGSYGVSVSASHYDWAMKKIRQHLKTYK